MTLDVSPFDPTMVFVWAENAEKARRAASGYLTGGVERVHATGLTQPGSYEMDQYGAEVIEPSVKRYSVKGSLR